MNATITVVQVFLAVGFTVGGLLKLIIPHATYTKLPFQGWSNDFKAWHVKLIGVLELSGGVGLIVPLFLPSLTMFTPLAALGIALTVAGASPAA